MSKNWTIDVGPEELEDMLTGDDEVVAWQISPNNWPQGLVDTVGRDLRSGRIVAPRPGDTYDDSVGISFRDLDVEFKGVKITATPRRIGVRDVAKFAKSSCRSCHGLGWWKVTRAMKRDDGAVQNFEFEQSCSCADKRYKEQHKMFVIDAEIGEWIALDNLKIERLGDGDR